MIEAIRLVVLFWNVGNFNEHRMISERLMPYKRGMGQLICVRASYGLRTVSWAYTPFVLTPKRLRMNEPLKHTTQAEWPDYHNNPFRLTTQEIENPNTVIDQFFESYHLPDIRACLDEWLHDGMLVETIESKKHFSTHKDIEKLVEACWLLRQNNKAIKGLSPKY